MRIRILTGEIEPIVISCDGEVLGLLLVLLLLLLLLLFLRRQIWSHRLDAIATLDNVSLERDRPRAAVQLEEQAAGIAEDGTKLVATP